MVREKTYLIITREIEKKNDIPFSIYEIYLKTKMNYGSITKIFKYLEDEKKIEYNSILNKYKNVFNEDKKHD